MKFTTSKRAHLCFTLDNLSTSGRNYDYISAKQSKKKFVPIFVCLQKCLCAMHDTRATSWSPLSYCI